MPVALGTTTVNAVYHGSTLIADLRHGSTQIPISSGATVPDAPTGVGITVSDLTVPDAPTGVGVTVSEGVDEFYSDVSLLLQDSLADESYSGHTLTYHGNAGLDSDSKVGSYSYLFNGSSDKITTTADSSLELDADFTIEFWAKTTQSYGSGGRRFYCIRQSGTSAANALIFGTSNGGVNASLNYVGTTITSSGVTVNDGNWHHYAATRSGSNLELWVDGISRATGTTSATPSQVGLVLAIGHDHLDQANKNFVGRIDGLRVTKGVARYTTAFTPPAAAFPTTNGDPEFANVSLLVQENLADESLNGLTITWPSGFSQTTDNVSGTYGILVSGNGTAVRAVLPNDSALDLGTGDFTIEGWFKVGSPDNYGSFLHNTWNTSWVAAFAVGMPFIGGKCRLAVNNTTNFNVDGTSDLRDNQWHHVAATRSGTTVRLFVDGVVEGTGTSSNSLSWANAHMCDVTGQYANNNDNEWGGVFDMFRITKGVARYTANFTPPTQELPN